MPKRVLDVGQCAPDHASIRRLVESHFNAEVVQTHGLDDTLAALRDEQFDLVLINRKLDRDYSDGIEILKQIKADADLAHLPVMLITNFDEHHDIAVAAGGERGFGKAELDRSETREKLAAILEAQ
ncbi:MAG: response regulator [Pirellulales bacterium]|nr:response regulator [Pirellulales bacterium]